MIYDVEWESISYKYFVQTISLQRFVYKIHQKFFGSKNIIFQN